MDLLNPKNLLEKFVAPYLEQYVESYEDMDLDIGLRGEITLINVTLKQRERITTVSPGISFFVEYGFIEELQISVPWTEIVTWKVPWMTGNSEGKSSVLARVEGCNLAIKLIVSENFEQGTESQAQSIEGKLREIMEEEAKILKASPEKWISSKVGGFWASSLEKIMSGVDLSVERLKCSVLLPTEFREDLLVHMNVSAIDIDDNEDSAEGSRDYSTSAWPDKDVATDTGVDDDGISGLIPGGSSNWEDGEVISGGSRVRDKKDLTIRGLDLSIGQDLVSGLEIKQPGDFRSLMNKLRPQDLLLNPTHILATLWLEAPPQDGKYTTGEARASEISHLNDIDSDIYHSGDDSDERDVSPGEGTEKVFRFAHKASTLHIESHISNLEITPKLRQLLLLRSFASRVSSVIMRWRVMHLHPSFTQDMMGVMPFDEDEDDHDEDEEPGFAVYSAEAASGTDASMEEQKKNRHIESLRSSINAISSTTSSSAHTGALVRGYPARRWWQYAIHSVILLLRRRVRNKLRLAGPSHSLIYGEGRVPTSRRKSAASLEAPKGNQGAVHPCYNRVSGFAEIPYERRVAASVESNMWGEDARSVMPDELSRSLIFVRTYRLMILRALGRSRGLGCEWDYEDQDGRSLSVNGESSLSSNHEHEQGRGRSTTASSVSQRASEAARRAFSPVSEEEMLDRDPSMENVGTVHMERHRSELALVAALHRIMTPRTLSILRLAVIVSLDKEMTLNKLSRVRPHNLRSAAEEVSRQVAAYLMGPSKGTEESHGKQVLGTAYARRYVHQIIYMPLLVDSYDLATLRSCYDLHSGHFSSYGLITKMKFTRIAMVVLQQWDTEELRRASGAYNGTGASAQAMNNKAGLGRVGPSSAVAAKMDRAFTLALYGVSTTLCMCPQSTVAAIQTFNGVHTDFLSTAKADSIPQQGDAGLLECPFYHSTTIGAARAYGYGNVEMLSCGQDPNAWLFNFDSHGSTLVKNSNGGPVSSAGQTNASVGTSASESVTGGLIATADIDTSSGSASNRSEKVLAGQRVSGSIEASKESSIEGELHADDPTPLAGDQSTGLNDEPSRNCLTWRSRLLCGSIVPLQTLDSQMDDNSDAENDSPDAASQKSGKRLSRGHLDSSFRMAPVTLVWDHLTMDFLIEVISILGLFKRSSSLSPSSTHARSASAWLHDSITSTRSSSWHGSRRNGLGIYDFFDSFSVYKRRARLSFSCDFTMEKVSLLLMHRNHSELDQVWEASDEHLEAPNVGPEDPHRHMRKKTKKKKKDVQGKVGSRVYSSSGTTASANAKSPYRQRKSPDTEARAVHIYSLSGGHVGCVLVSPYPDSCASTSKVVLLCLWRRDPTLLK